MKLDFIQIDVNYIVNKNNVCEIQYIFIANEYRNQDGNGKPYYTITVMYSAISIVEIRNSSINATISEK